MGRAWVHKEADDRRWQLPPKFVLRDIDEKEKVIQLCLLLDPKMIDIPFDSWDEQEAFELVLTFDDIGRRVLGVPIPPDNR